MQGRPLPDDWLTDLRHLEAWGRDVFLFAEEAMNILPAEPLDWLKGKEIPYEDAYGVKHTARLFDENGKLTHWDLKFYSVDMFKNQDKASFRQYNGTRLTWQQTVILTAYNRALATFNKDSFDIAARWITTRSGHGIGKTGSEAIVSLHFLFCYPGAQIGMTANTEQQVEDIFMKELGVWAMKMPQFLQDNIEITKDHVRVVDTDDWFLRAQVARPEKPEALAGLHGPYVLILVEEASGVADKVTEVMKGALTGACYIVMYFSNPTRNEGEFYDSHKKGAKFTQLHFTSRESPIVEDGFIQRIEEDYPSPPGTRSDQVLIRIDGEFAGVNEMDDKGWIPLFANVRILFEGEHGQIINGAIIGVDPAGAGKDRSVVHIRDTVYLKEVLSEATSQEKDLARKIETIRDGYGCKSSDIGIDAFGIGAKVVANINTKIGESVNALLTDKPREGTEHEFVTFRDELAWKLRSWLLAGGIIITNNPQAWLKEFSKVKYKRVRPGRIQLQSKVEYRKDNGFSPDRFDAAIYTFFKEEPTRQVIYTKNEMEAAEAMEFMKRATQSTVAKSTSSV